MRTRSTCLTCILTRLRVSGLGYVRTIAINEDQVHLAFLFKSPPSGLGSRALGFGLGVFGNKAFGQSSRAHGFLASRRAKGYSKFERLGLHWWPSGCM